MGTAEAVAKAVRIIQNLSAETGLNLKRKKCHLHGAAQVIEQCKSMSDPNFPGEINFHSSLDMIYLKAPIGSDEFVSTWLNDKLQEPLLMKSLEQKKKKSNV